MLPGYAFTPDGKSIVTSLGTKLWRIDAATGARTAIPFTVRVRMAPVSSGGANAHTGFACTPSLANGSLLLRGGRIVTMSGNEVIERGDVLVTNGRIAQLGTAIQAPSGTHVVDVSGKTILPGYVDAWSMLGPPLPERENEIWELAANVAYGVTAIREVTPDTGRAPSPKLTCATEGSEPSARVVADPLRDSATAKHGPLTKARWSDVVSVTSGSELRGNIQITPIGADVVHLMTRSDATYIPGLVLNDASPAPFDRYIARNHYHDDVKLQRFVPQVLLDKLTLKRDQWMPDSVYRAKSFAADAKRIIDAGGRVAVGTRGVLPGMAMHWEMWTLREGGVAPIEVLRAATIGSAHAIGRDYLAGLGAPVSSLSLMDMSDTLIIRSLTGSHGEAVVKASGGSTSGFRSQ